jgi:hypothetical protein
MVESTASKLMEKKWVQMMLALLAVTVSIALVVYATYRVFKTSLKMVKVTRNGLIAGDGPGALVRSSAIPSSDNGAEFGYGVWVYLERAQKTNNPKQVIDHASVRLVMGANDN